MTYLIDILTLRLALNHFESLGYEHLSAPMLVDLDVINVTLPKGRLAKEHKDGLYYVGSAEQSVLQLIKDGKSLTSKYMMITPCQRDEEYLDDTHLEIFLKVELISFDLSVDILQDVFNFYNDILKVTPEIVTINEDQKDININTIEVGSYGTNIFRNIKYKYGTGLALPRLTQAINYRY